MWHKNAKATSRTTYNYLIDNKKELTNIKILS